MAAPDVRMTVWLGLLVVLLGHQALRFWPDAPAPAPPPALAVDPYAEARRSRAILEAQKSAPTPLLAEQGLPEAAPAVRVIDGDTFVHNGLRIRIADIDTPEVDARCAHEAQLADRATRRLRVLLADGPFELRRLPGGRDEDRYGRKLRLVIRDGSSLGDRLVAEGLARTWSGRREPWCA